MEKENFGYQLFFKGTDILYRGSKDFDDIMYFYEHCSFKKDLELRLVTERNPKSCWIW